MEEYISSSDESSSSVANVADDEMEDHNRHTLNFYSQGTPTNPGMEQARIEQPTLYRCSFCCFQVAAQKMMQDHIMHHFIKSSHQCELCTFSIGTVPELYLHIQQHHVIEHESNLKVSYRTPGGKRIRVRSATFSCGQCEFVTKYNQELQRHEIRHKEKSNFQCGLCSYSVSTSFHLTMHLERHHNSAQQNTLAPTQQEVRTTGPPSTAHSETELLTAHSEVLLQEVRTESLIPPVEQVQPLTLNKWRVELYQTRDGSRPAPRVSKEERPTVNGVKPARLRVAQRLMTVNKASQRRKTHGMLNHAQISMKKKMNKLIKRKSKPQEADAAAPVDAVPNSFQNNRKKDKLKRKQPLSKEVDVAAPGRLDHVNETTESTRNSKKRPKAGNEQEDVEYKCPDCGYSSPHLSKMKRHKEKHNREEKFKCDHCSFSARLKRHVSLHSTRFHREQPAAAQLKCSDCDYSTTRWDDMKRHRRRHEQEEKFKCGQCSYSAHSKSHVSLHSIRFHPEQSLAAPRYKCSDCDYFSGERYKMKRHRLRHEQEEKFKCDRCSYSARSKSQASLHSQNYHRNPLQPKEAKECHGSSIQKTQLITRIENMKRKVSTAEQEKKRILAKKKDVEQKIRETEKKLKAELTLRGLLEKQQNSFATTTEVREKTKRLQTEERILRRLHQEERNLNEEEMNAEESLVGANQVLQALESELMKVKV